MSEPIFGAIPTDPVARFEQIRTLLRRWHGIALGPPGGQPERVAQVQTSAGRPLPVAVREWVALIYDIDDAGGWERVFRDCISFERVKGHKAFSLMVQGEDDLHCPPSASRPS